MRCVRAVNALQQLLANRMSAMDAVRTLWERRVDTVGTLFSTQRVGKQYVILLLYRTHT